MLLTTCIELKHIKAYKNEPFSFGKSSRRYLPYSNVDIFLKVSFTILMVLCGDVDNS